jgi:starch synthase
LEDYHCEERLQDTFNPSAINLTRGAINYADFITTVSPRYAWEARFTDQGYGLGHTLFRNRDRFGGIINGLDCEFWDPQTDPALPYAYHADDLEPKYANKRALRERLGLKDDFQPILAHVGNLTSQKGVHLIRHALFNSLEHGAQFVLLGAGMEDGINEEFSQLKHRLRDNAYCHLELAFDEELAHLIYAGADMIVIPSLLEPCGQAQMIALRYGSIPIVHGVGGLVDTVFDRDYSEKARQLRNGYVFHEPDYQGVESALQRAIGLWHSFPREFRQLIHNGMHQDVSWRPPALDYINIYQHITSAHTK